MKFNGNSDFMEVGNGLIPLEDGWYFDKETGYRVNPEGQVFDGNECIFDPTENLEEADADEAEKDSFVPPAGVRAEARRALQWMKDGQAGGGFTSVGRKRASQLAGGQPVGIDTIRRMSSYLARHSVDKKGKGFSPGEPGYPSPGRVAWAAWGGDPAIPWVNGILRRYDKDTKK